MSTCCTRLSVFIFVFFFATDCLDLTKRSPPVRLCPAGRARDPPQWTGTPEGDGACHCCMLGAGIPAAERHSAAHLGPTLLHRLGRTV